jgi:hypothetical protein
MNDNFDKYLELALQRLDEVDASKGLSQEEDLRLKWEDMLRRLEIEELQSLASTYHTMAIRRFKIDA